MIKLKNEIETIKVENSGNIEGTIYKEMVLTPTEMMDKALMFSRIVIPAGSCIKEHPHNPEAEIYYILEGEVEVADNGSKATLHSGDVVFTGGGDTHSIKNIGTTNAVFMAVILK
ncbi:MAG: cupin domain-containing protein [Bacteroidales bacterium]|nr:cupin domain-containing protein [Bacteroidales bacterium]